MIGASLNLGDIYALLTAASWGVAIIFFRLAGNHFRAVPLKMLHNAVVTSLFGISALLFTDTLIPGLTGGEWARLILSAVIGITIADTTHIETIRRLGASGGALLDTLYLPMVMLMALYFYGEILGPKEVIGGFIVLLGVGIGSFEPNHLVVGRKDLLIGVLLGVVTQFGHAATIMLVKDILIKEPVLTLSFIRFIIGSVCLFLIYSRRESLHSLFAAFTLDRRLLVSVPGAFLGLFLSTFLWFLGFKYTLAGRAAIYNQLAIVFVFILAALFLREKMSPKRLLAVTLAVGGSLLVALA